MIGYFRSLLDGIQELGRALQTVAVLLEELLRERNEVGDLPERIERLERARAMWEAEMEAAMERADSKFKAARAAEERARGKERRAEALQEKLDPGDEESEGPSDEWIERWMEELSRRDGAGSQPEGVPAVRPDVERRLAGRERAKRAKRGY